MESVNKEEFKTYERIRQSGITNMFDIPKVIELSFGVLNKDKIIMIMRDYSELKSIYMKDEN